MQHMNDKVVLITGGAAGIGRAAALQFARAGARVVVTGRREAPLEALAAEHAGIDYIVADAGKPAEAVRTIGVSSSTCPRPSATRPAPCCRTMAPARPRSST